MVRSIQYGFYKLLSAGVCLFPYSLLLAAGRQLGKLYYCIAAKQRKRALRQIQEHLNLSPEAAERIIRRVFIKLSQTFLEVLYMPRLNKQSVSEYITIENRSYLEEALAEGKGVILLAAHFGNWEWLGAGLALFGFPLTSFAKRQPNEVYMRILAEHRSQAGIEIFYSKSLDLISAAKALKQGKTLGFISDQDAGPKGIFVDFLGQQASTPAGAAVFAKKIHSPVVPTFIVRRKTGGHQILLGEPFYFESDDTIQSFTQKLSTITENMIREYPDEWLWFQKRWNTKVPVARKEGDA
jgi:Kdo2-lipid IVA lauroyltransferase/acyltransferase